MRLRQFLFVVAAVLVVVPGWTGDVRLALLGNDAAIGSSRIALDPGDPARRRVGRLVFMGGVRLDSPDPAFGGFSALAVTGTATGDRVTMLSDGGNVAALTLRGDGTVLAPRFANLPAGPGTGWQKHDRDSESMAVDPRTGRVWIGFERANAIWRYDAGFGRAEAAARPRAMRRWWENAGPETLVRRRDGSFIAIQEGPRGALREGLVWAGDPTVRPGVAFRFRYRPPAGFVPTDAAELPDGRLLVLNRRWRWGVPLRFESALVVIGADAIGPGATVAGMPVARLGPPLIHDNFEGLAVTVERGRTIVWLVNDNDGSLLRPTMLLKFRLD